MPLARHDKMTRSYCSQLPQFLLPCLLRGMTLPSVMVYIPKFISTPMPLARHDIICIILSPTPAISTPMPLARHDVKRIAIYHLCWISTPMPLARHDSFLPHIAVHFGYFYSHASCEAWRCQVWIVNIYGGFLLPCLLRGMTTIRKMYVSCSVISTPMPLARHDRASRSWSRGCRIFLLPCLLRGMTIHPQLLTCPPRFLLPCLLRGMTFSFRLWKRQPHISTPMPLARHDMNNNPCNIGNVNFYSHASCEAWLLHLVNSNNNVTKYSNVDFIFHFWWWNRTIINRFHLN